MMGWIGDVGLDESIAFLREKIHKDGPYQGVIGFSQGASMAHYLLSAGLVTRGILFSPVLPLGRAWPPLENRQYSAVIFFDPADMTGESYPRKGMTGVLHNENHSVPLLTDQIRDEITRIMSL
jgi:dienelactone hydrolase